MKKISILITSLISFLIIQTPASSEILYQETLSSTVYVEVYNSIEDYGWGTGFFISIDGFVLTNSHVVIDPLTAEPYAYINICTIEDEFSIPLCEYSARVLAYDEYLDLAIIYPAYYLDEEGNETGELLEQEDIMALELPYADFSDDLTELGQKIKILGFPEASGSLTVVLTEGIISAYTPLMEDLMFYFTTTATINPGNSGGPVYSEDERIIGIANALSTNEIGGSYGYVITHETIAYWMLNLVEEGILNEEYVEQIFNNDYIEDFASHEYADLEIFADVDFDDMNAEAIWFLKTSGVVNGYPDGTFKPTGPLNRAELLKILVEGMGYSPDASIYKDCFPDVGTEWFAKYICFAKENGWVGGYPDGTFQPANNVNKVEALKMILEIFGIPTSEPVNPPYEDVPLGQWHTKYISTAKEMGLLEETGSHYWPASNITRGGVSENIYRVILYGGE